MTEIHFYHLQSTPLEKALPKLMEKVWASGKHAVLLAPTEEKVEMLNSLLWTYSTRTFLPHGSKVDGNIEEQPIYLTNKEENPNQASILVSVDDMAPCYVGQFDRCLELFDGSQEQSVKQARERWQGYKQSGHGLVYFKQTEQGTWERV